MKEAVAKGRKSYVEFSVQSKARPREGLADLKAAQLVARIRGAASKKQLRSKGPITSEALAPLVRQALSEQTFAMRKASEIGIAWNDPTLAIAWPIDQPLLSDRDRRNPTLNGRLDVLPVWTAN